jgi:hypothetical protein
MPEFAASCTKDIVSYPAGGGATIVFSGADGFSD